MWHFHWLKSWLILNIISWVPEVFLARFPVSIMSVLWPRRSCRPAGASAEYFRPPCARKSSGTQDMEIVNTTELTAMLSSVVPWNIPRVTCIFSRYLHESRYSTVYQERALHRKYGGQHNQGWTSYRRIYNGFLVFWLAVFSVARYK